MLQQTRVDVVVPYFERFVNRFPDVASLAGARSEEVLQAWAGLGYYSRARNLHAAAREIVRDCGGRLPTDAAALEALPGIGRYTAGAICSIAYDTPTPILDGNVVRVFARLFAMHGDLETGAARARLWEISARWARCRTPGDANQALMELGALLCTKPVPACERCPLRADCCARRSGAARALPAPRRRATVERLHLGAGLVHRDGRLLVLHRRSGRLLRDWWEVPTCEPRPARSRAEASVRPPASATGREEADALQAALRSRVGVRVRGARHLGFVRHGILSRRLEVSVVDLPAVAWSGEPLGVAPSRTGRTGVDARCGTHRAAFHRGPAIANLELAELEAHWVDSAECRALPLSTLTCKVLRVAAMHDARWSEFLPAAAPRTAVSAAPPRAPSARRSSRRGT